MTEPVARPGADVRVDAGRLAAMVLLVGAAVALVVFQQGYRNLEAVLASHLFAGGDIRTWAGGDSPIVVFRLGETRAFGLEITPECTSAFLIAPFAVLGAAMLLRRRIRPGRVLLGVGLVALLLFIANQLRVAMIAGLINGYGLEQGYQWGHLVLGSLLSIVFIGLSAVLLIYVVASGHVGRHVVSADA